MEASPEGVANFLEKFNNLLKEKIEKTEEAISEYKGRKFVAATPECIERMQTWEMPENSVIISSFPKTGTAWCTEIVRHILYKDSAAMEKSRTIPAPLLLLEMGMAMKFDFFNQLPVDRKFFCTHVPADLFDFEMMKKTKSKMIYMYRNPKDQAVSWFHFVKKLPVSDATRRELGESWEDFYNNYVNGRHPMGFENNGWYPEHLLGWMNYKGDESFLPVEYEAMKRDFHKEIRRIAKFLEVDLDDEEVDKVAKACSIGSMQKAAETEKSGFLKMNVRKGQVGGWKDVLTVAQSELMDKVIDEKLSGSGIDFTYVL